MRYCPECGAPLSRKEIEGRPRAYCPRCGKVFYARPKVGAGCLIEEAGRLLLLRRAREPFKGCWNLPAGYVEIDEAPSETAVRETREETGLQVEARALIDVYPFADDPRGNGLLIVYRCEITGGEMRETAEGKEGTFFSKEALPDNLAGGGHDRAIRAWAEARE